MEVIIVIAIVALIAVSYPLTVNFRQQTDKANDSRRKSDLSLMKRILEDFYNDNSRYPTPFEVCYNATTGVSTCNICGSRNTPSAIASYQKNIVCDPQFPREDYVYQVDDTNRPTWYIIYVKLSNTSDPSIEEINCTNGCGPNNEYNYGTSSDNVNVATGGQPPFSCPDFNGPLYSSDSGICNICGTYPNCLENHNLGSTFYIESTCTNPCVNP